MKHLAVLGLTLFLAFPARAQTPPTAFVTRLFEAVATYGPPPWAKGMSDTLASEVFRNQGKSANGTEFFILEFVPKGENFDTWSQLYAVLAEMPLSGALESYRNGVANGYAGACDDSAVQLIATTTQFQLFIAFCPAYRANPAQGEIMIMAMRRHRSTMVKNYYHKRAAAFQMDSPESWPMSQAQIDETVAQLQSFSLIAP